MLVVQQSFIGVSVDIGLSCSTTLRLRLKIDCLGRHCSISLVSFVLLFRKNYWYLSLIKEVIPLAVDPLNIIHLRSIIIDSIDNPLRMLDPFHLLS